jgi:hypothetical protein
MRLRQVLSIPLSFVLMNCAAVIALYHFLRGSRNIWKEHGRG